MKKINHIGVAVYSLDDSVEIFKKVLNINPSKKETVESEGVETIFFNLGESKIELIS
ncbi:MAG: methylmalonyl-CoA epimerase, partial [Flavobacteriales bacterium TMED84]